jgi:hypothetical protein
MMDRTGKEHSMKRTAIVLGVAAALAVPSVASAGSNSQVVAQVKPQLKSQVVAQVVTAQVAKTHVAQAQVRAQRVVAARVRAQVATAHRRSALGTKIVPLGTRTVLLRGMR